MELPTYDFVIVGAGSAGCVLANRLSADPAVRVLVLEAGPEDSRREISIPPAFSRLIKSEVDWAYTTAPEPQLHGRELLWPRGKVLGGSSSINAQLYVRGHRRDYDRWQERGNPGWSYRDVLPYFRRSERQERGESLYHGVEGPLDVCDPRDPNILSRCFVQAGEELGFRPSEDFNGERQEGFGLYQVNQRRGERCSAAVAFLRPVLARENLHVLTDARASKVILEGRRARGVEYLLGDTRYRAWADREVVLSGGAINSPQLLMLSGIGPADHLARYGIRPRLDLPGVGRGLQDHCVVSVVYACRNAVTLDRADSLGNRLRYLLTRRGPLTTTICEAGGFVRTRAHEPQPDLQFHFVPAAVIEHGMRRAADRGFNLGPTLLRPRSRGAIELTTADPLAPPVIHANYLAEPRDLQVLLEGVKLARELARTRAFEPFRREEVLPGPEVESDRQIEEFVRGTLATMYHPVGSCRMGRDPHGRRGLPAVVDAELKVHGAYGLRVVDASIMPEIVAGNTNAPTIMVAEKAADLILGRGAARPALALEDELHPAAPWALVAQSSSSGGASRTSRFSEASSISERMRG